MKHPSWGATLIALLVSITHCWADVRPVQISVQCSNVVLTWPSQSGESFTVQYRPTLSTNTPWVTLTNLLRAAVVGSVTTFVHSNVTDCPQSGGGGGGAPAAPGGSQAASGETTMTDEQRAQRREELRRQAEAIAKYLWNLLVEAVARAVAERERWKSDGRPTTQTASGGESPASPEGGEMQSASSMGFYRVFKTSPTAYPDFFGIQQDSGPNQLGIFDNDFDPDDDVFLLSSVTSASHGAIEYSDNAFTFRYTPEPGFFGTDTFSYTVSPT